MIFQRLGWPVARAYWRASFMALSTASEPPETKKTRDKPAGIRAERRAARVSEASVSKCRR